MAITPCSDPKQIMQHDPVDVMLARVGKTTAADLSGIYEPDPEDDMAIGITRPRPVFDPVKVTNKELAEDVLWQYRKVRKRMKGLTWSVKVMLGPSDKLRAMHASRKKKSPEAEAKRSGLHERFTSPITSAVEGIKEGQHS